MRRMLPETRPEPHGKPAGMSFASTQCMPARPTKLLRAILASALLFAAAAQGLSLMRCGSTLRMQSSCCAKDAPPVGPQIAGAHFCCDRFDIPVAPPGADPRNIQLPAPSQFAILAPQTAIEIARLRSLPVPRLDSWTGPPLALTNCALLI